MAGSKYVLVLMCVSFHQVLMDVYRKYDPMLDKMATDVVEDIVYELVPFSQGLDQIRGPPDVDGFVTSFRIAGIKFQIEADVGKFIGFPTLHSVGKTTVSVVYSDPEDRMNYVGLRPRISFKTFVIHYKNITVTAQDSHWNGELTVMVRKNEFIPRFSVSHDIAKGACGVVLNLVSTVEYTDADLTIKVDGLPEFRLKHVPNKAGDWSAYGSLVVTRLFHSYLNMSFPDSGSRKELENPLRYCSFNTGSFPSIERLRAFRKQKKSPLRRLRPRLPLRLTTGPNKGQKFESYQRPMSLISPHRVQVVHREPIEHSKPLPSTKIIMSQDEPLERRQHLPISHNEPLTKRPNLAVSRYDFLGSRPKGPNSAQFEKEQVEQAVSEEPLRGRTSQSLVNL